MTRLISAFSTGVRGVSVLDAIDARKSATAVADEARRWENVDKESVDWDAWDVQERQRATR